MLDRSYRPALVTLLLVTIGFVVSFVGGFSIGRFSAVLPLLLTAFAVTYGRALWLQVAAYLAAILYVLFAWVIPDQVHYCRQSLDCWGAPGESSISVRR